ncbi:MAG TPA: helix-turn-helix domain-containing protein, partial [Solirubrobacteraceae bacterium]
MPRAPAPRPYTQELSARERELLAATVEVLDEYGYDRLTIEEVAARARASKATIYRRWPSKAVLITAAMAARMDMSAFDERLDGAPLRDELLHLVRRQAAEAREMRAIIAGILGEAVRNDELRATIEEHFVKPRRD